MKAIAEQWEDFLLKVIPSDAPPIKVSEMRRAFYAGVQSLYSAIMVGLDPDAESTGADLARMEAIQTEPLQFAKDVGEGRA